MFTEKQSYIGGIQKNAPSLISNGSGDICLTCNIGGDTECTITLMDVAPMQKQLCSHARMPAEKPLRTQLLCHSPHIPIRLRFRCKIYTISRPLAQTPCAHQRRCTKIYGQTQPCYRNGPIHQWGSWTMRWMREGKTSPGTFPKEIPKPS